MRKVIHNPSIVQDLGALAGLYRTVFWMMGRKVQYGQVWPEPLQRPTPKPSLHISVMHDEAHTKEFVRAER